MPGRYHPFIQLLGQWQTVMIYWRIVIKSVISHSIFSLLILFMFTVWYSSLVYLTFTCWCRRSSYQVVGWHQPHPHVIARPFFLPWRWDTIPESGLLWQNCKLRLLLLHGRIQLGHSLSSIHIWGQCTSSWCSFFNPSGCCTCTLFDWFYSICQSSHFCCHYSYRVCLEWSTLLNANFILSFLSVYSLLVLLLYYLSKFTYWSHCFRLKA